MRLFPAAAFGCLLAAALRLGAQQAPAPSTATTSANPPAGPLDESTAANASANGQGSDTVVLNPFEVRESNRGYYSGNSMSATRFNSKLDDVGSSITVITKKQMEDFSMLDINDVFLYAGSTMGTGTFTDYTIDRNGSVSDNVQLNPTAANRVRGVSSANISFANFETTGRVPLDPIVADAIEVFRGPNATVFGLGNPGGTVNTDPAMPLLRSELTDVQSRVDSYGGYRESLDVSRPLIQGKLAIRGSAVFQHDAFVRKPSGVNTVRYNGMIEYKPFPKTTISGAVYWYRMDGTRPNFSPPRDYISYWLQNGKPTWDPVTMTIHVNGQTLGPYTASTYNGPDYFENTFTGSAHSYVFVGQQGVGYWSAPTTFSNAAGPTSGGLVDRYMATSSAAGTNLGKFLTQPLFSTTPSINNKALYDWTSVNLAAINYDRDSALTSYATIDQTFLEKPWSTLNVQAAVFREDTQRYQRNLVGTANDNGQSGQLFVDVNERNLDGSPNPFFLRPYIGTDQPRTVSAPARWTTYRAQAIDVIDFTQEPGWWKWLGLHQLSGYDEYKYRINRQYSFKDSFTNNLPWLAAGTPRANQGAVTNGPPAGPNITKNYFRYYVGGPAGTGAVQYAPTNFQYGTYPYVWGNNTTGVFNTESDTLGQVAVTDSTGGSNNVKTLLKTRGALLQSHWLQDRIVTTAGVREDFVFTKFGGTPQLNPDGETFNYQSINVWAPGDWRFSSGRTTEKDIVVRPFKDLGWFNHALGTSTLGENVAEVFNTMGFYLDRSDSFIPQSPAQDILGNILPNQTGKGKEWGVTFSAFDNRLHVKINRYIDESINNRQGDASTISTRVTRLDLQVSSDAFPLATQATAWVTALNPTWTTAQIQTEIAKEIGLTTAQQNALLAPNPPLAATQDVTSNGTELEVFFTPQSNLWTVGINGSHSAVINSNVSTALQTWINERMPIWTTIVDPRTNTLWWNTNYGGSQTPSQNFASFVQAPYDLIQQQNGKSNPQNPAWMFRTFGSLKLASLWQTGLMSRFDVNGAARWQSRSAIGYYGLQQLPAAITQLDANHPIWGDKWNWQFDAGIGYTMTMFSDKIRTRIQVVCRNLLENGGRLSPIGAYPDGTPNTYRIVDPRTFIATVKFDL